MQLPLDLIAVPEPRLTDGVPGRNAQALAALAQVIDPSRRGFASLLLWGNPGAGKTFWLKAWVAQAGQRAIYVDCGPVVAADATTSDARHTLWDRVLGDRSVADPVVWCLDNVDQADADTVNRLFQLYNVAREAGWCCVATASAPPLRMTLRDDLRTRLGQSLIFELHELDDEEKKNALRERAEQLACPLPEDLLQYLMTRLPRDLGRLMGVLQALNDYALSRQRAVTIPLLKELLDTSNANTRTV